MSPWTNHRSHAPVPDRSAWLSSPAGTCRSWAHELSIDSNMTILNAANGTSEIRLACQPTKKPGSPFFAKTWLPAAKIDLRGTVAMAVVVVVHNRGRSVRSVRQRSCF
eukprot:SAG22_NODE_955_length_6331_cov_21.329108_10_plen_108_part_00